MKCPLPTNQTFKNFNNFIEITEYINICNEFNIGPNSDFILKLQINNSASYMYNKNNKKLVEEYHPNKFSFEHLTG